LCGCIIYCQTCKGKSNKAFDGSFHTAALWNKYSGLGWEGGKLAGVYYMFYEW
jgi:hypothetical protein